MHPFWQTVNNINGEQQNIPEYLVEYISDCLSAQHWINDNFWEKTPIQE